MRAMTRSVLHWLGLSLLFVCWVLPRAWLAIPNAVHRARPISREEYFGLSIASKQRLQVWPMVDVPERFRLAPLDRWLELSDDQVLPCGLYEPEIHAIYDSEGWRAASIAMLRRNAAQGWCMAQGELLAVNMRSTSRGARPQFHADRTWTPGRWLGTLTLPDGRVLWQLIGAWQITGTRVLEVNAGYVIHDWFAGSWQADRVARLRPPALRLRKVTGLRHVAAAG